MVVDGLSLVPIQVASSQAADIVKAQRERLEKMKNKYPPGLKEQHEVQLQHLEDKDSADFELFPFAFGFPQSFPEPEKPYCNFVTILSRPFSRGTIVSLSTR